MYKLNKKGKANLIKWFKEIISYDFFDEEALIKEAETQMAMTGQPHYEVCRWETRSGNPEEYSFDKTEYYIEKVV